MFYNLLQGRQSIDAAFTERSDRTPLKTVVLLSFQHYHSHITHFGSPQLALPFVPRDDRVGTRADAFAVHFVASVGDKWRYAIHYLYVERLD